MQTKTLELVNEHLFLSETQQEDLTARISGQWEDIKIVDVIGLTEEKSTIYGYIKVVYNGYCYLINFKMVNKWAFIYKDEYIEILEDLGMVIGKAIEKEMGQDNTILDDVKIWANEQLESYDNIIDVLDELATYGCESGNVPFLIYYDDIQKYYSNHYEEINSIIENEVGVTIDNAIDNEEDFEELICNIGGIDCEMSFEDSEELENSELAYLVWFAFEYVAYEYMLQLEDK